MRGNNRLALPAAPWVPALTRQSAFEDYPGPIQLVSVRQRTYRSRLALLLSSRGGTQPLRERRSAAWKSNVRRTDTQEPSSGCAARRGLRASAAASGTGNVAPGIGYQRIRQQNAASVFPH